MHILWLLIKVVIFFVILYFSYLLSFTFRLFFDAWRLSKLPLSNLFTRKFTKISELSPEIQDRILKEYRHTLETKYYPYNTEIRLVTNKPVNNGPIRAVYIVLLFNDELYVY